MLSVQFSAKSGNVGATSDGYGVSDTLWRLVGTEDRHFFELDAKLADISTHVKYPDFTFAKSGGRDRVAGVGEVGHVEITRLATSSLD